jgi:hypothetical protein
MPRDGNIPTEHMTAAEKLRHLADFMETLDQEQLDLRTVDHPCGTTHCAWGWGETIGLFPRSTSGNEAESGEDDAAWTREMLSAEEGRSTILGLTDKQFRTCFGIGYQFRFLNRPYTPADVAHNLRQTAAELETEILNI